MEAGRAGGRFRYEYGSGPAHLAAQLGLLAVVGYAFFQIAEVTDPYDVLIWLAGAIVAHDLVLLPLYSLLGAGIYLGVTVVLRGRADEPLRLMVLNHVRVPLLLAGLLLVVWFPSILGLAEATVVPTTGQSTDGYLERWLVASGALLAASGLALAGRLAWRRRSAPATSSRASPS